MLIAIPSYRRHSNGAAQTFAHLPQVVGFHHVAVFVREEEREHYESLLVQHGHALHWKIVGIPTGTVDGIATTRNFILDWARGEQHKKVCMVDDDLHFIQRGLLPDNDVHLRPCEDVSKMFDWLSDALEKYAHAAVSMREGNNRLPGLGAYMEASRGIRVVAYNLPDLENEKIRFRPEVEGREDLDMTLQLLRRGLPNCVTYHWAQGQKSAQAPGGLSDARNLENIHSSAEKLAELHPGLVKLRSKTNKSGGLAGERTEVTIYWKKALLEGIVPDEK
jgi:hypothetical protein